MAAADLRIFATLSVLLLSACGTTPAVDPQLAWLSLRTPPGDVISAQRLDGQRLDRSNDLQLTPGAHELLLRYQYDSRKGSGQFGVPRRVTCRLRLHYAHFEAGRHYRLDARPLALKAQGWLYETGGTEPLARAEVLRCGPF